MSGAGVRFGVSKAAPDRVSAFSVQDSLWGNYSCVLFRAGLPKLFGGWARSFKSIFALFS